MEAYEEIPTERRKIEKEERINKLKISLRDIWYTNMEKKLVRIIWFLGI